MVKCSAPLCSNATYNKTPNITFHRFPKNESLKLAWLRNMNRPDWQPSASSLVCSKHFEAHLVDDSGHRTVLTSAAIPTIFDLGQETKPASTITNIVHVLPDNQNIQLHVSNEVHNYNKDILRKEEEIRKIKNRAILRNKKIKVLAQKNRRLQNKVLKFSRIISILKQKLKQDKMSHNLG